MSFFRNCVEGMSGYVPGEQPAADTPVIKLNTNENPYPPSPRVAEAILQELAGAGERLRLYSDPEALALRKAAAKRYGLAVEQILHGNGSDELLALLLRAMVDPGDQIAFPVPTYVLYETLARAQGALVEPHAFNHEYHLPETLFGSRAKLVFLASPNSPSGTTYGAHQIERLAKSLPRGVLVVDEAYAEFAASSALELLNSLPNLVVLRTFSKSHSLAGMRVGLAFASPEIIVGLHKVKDSYNLDRLAIAAAVASLQDTQWTRDNVERIRQTRDRLVTSLRELGLQVLPSEANFVLARFQTDTAARSAYQSLKQQNILVRYFDLPDLRDALRISVGTDPEIDRLLTALASLVT